MSRNEDIKVSILMPFFKVEQFLGKTLDSVFSQTYQNIEYVFVNDCSPDGSLNVLQESIAKHSVRPSRYTIVNHHQNEGVAVSRADCLTNAKGDYVYFVDSDDWIEPDAVEKMVDATKGGTIDIVGCDFMKDYEDKETTYHHEQYADTCHKNLMKCLNYDIATVLWKLLIRRSLFDNITITPHLDMGEDYILSIKLYYYSKNFIALPKAFYHYVQYNQARVSLKKRWSVNMHINCVKEVEKFLREKGLYDKDVENKMNLRKFNIKSNFLTKQLLDYKAYQETFPEVRHIWRKIGYSKKECLKFWLAEHNLFFILKLFQK